MEISSLTHKLTLDDESGEFCVWPLEQRQLHVTEFQDGVNVRDEIEAHPDAAATRLLEFVNSTPLFAANWAGDGWFNIDLDCGFQRWHGSKSERDVRVALRRCGFSLSQARMILGAAKVREHDWIRRYD